MEFDKNENERKKIKKIIMENQLNNTLGIYVRDRIYLRAIVMLLDDIDNLNARISILEANNE